MSLTLISAFPHVLGLIGADATAAVVPRLSQLDPDYVKKYEAALRKADVSKPGDGPGVIFVLWSKGGDAANGNGAPQLDLQNGFLLSVVESTKNNTTGKSALEWVSYLLRLLHRGAPQGRQATGDIRHPAQGSVYELGPLGQGLVIYFINLEVRSTEPLLTV